MENEELDSAAHFLWYTFGYIRGLIDNSELDDKQKLESISNFIDEYSEKILWEKL